MMTANSSSFVFRRTLASLGSDQVMIARPGTSYLIWAHDEGKSAELSRSRRGNVRIAVEEEDRDDDEEEEDGGGAEEAMKAAMTVSCSVRLQGHTPKLQLASRSSSWQPPRFI